MIRNQISLTLVTRAKRALLRCGVEKPSAVMFRCTREELAKLARITSPEELRSFAAARAAAEVRWLIIGKRFLP